MLDVSIVKYGQKIQTLMARGKGQGAGSKEQGVRGGKGH